MLERCRVLGVRILDALLPPRCLSCAVPVLVQDTLCQDCFGGLSLLGPPWCDRCGLPFVHAGEGRPIVGGSTGAGLGGTGLPGTGLAGTSLSGTGLSGTGLSGRLQCVRCLEHPPAFARARAAWLYDEASKRLLLPFKHFDRTELAGPLSRQMARVGRDLLARAELILPVPLHRWRLLSRRYNQAALLAARLGRLSSTPWAPDLLRRRRATPPLGGLGAMERAVLLEDVFMLSGGAARRIGGRRLLLVDDVMTSGATASACARVLLAGGARSVEVLAAARVPDPRLAEDPHGRPARDQERERIWQPQDSAA